MQGTKELIIKTRIVKMGLTMRVLIIFSSFFLKSRGGYLPSEFRQFIYILIPLSCFYIILFLKFIFKNAYKYPEKGKEVSRRYVHFGYYGLLGLNIIEFLLILYKALYAQPDMPQFVLYFVIIESLFGIIAGFYISDLFSDKSNVLK